jgi:hypothetical protein
MVVLIISVVMTPPLMHEAVMVIRSSAKGVLAEASMSMLLSSPVSIETVGSGCRATAPPLAWWLQDLLYRCIGCSGPLLSPPVSGVSLLICANNVCYCSRRLASNC